MAQFVKRRVANPPPSVLALVNKTRRKSMATAKKKKSSSKSRSTAAKSTPRRQTKPRHHNPPKKAQSSSKKHHTKTKRHSRPRHHNPLMSGESGQVLSFAGAGLSLGIAQPIVSNAVGKYLPFGQYNGPILTFGTGWLLSKLFEMLRFTKPLARPTFILGASTAVIQVTQPLVRNLIGGAAAGAPPLMQGPRGYYRRGQGMGAIGAVTGTPPRLVPMPTPPPANGAKKSGMGSVGVVPGRFRR